MTEQLEKIWKDEFGNSYTKRKLMVHEKEGQLRRSFWKKLIDSLPSIKSCLEFGCNAGMNLEGIYNANSKIKLTGLEPNFEAFKCAQKIAKNRYEIINNDLFHLPENIKADLVVTCTLLIHIHPEDLIEATKKIFNASNSYILSMEYYWPVLKEIEYRGHKNILWKRDFGAYWLDNYKLDIIDTGYLSPDEGFDRTTWWLLKKNN